VFGNIAVWFIEKFIPWDFEFLSVSYLFSEVILLGLYWMMQDYVRVDLISQPVQEAPRPVPTDPSMEEKLSRALARLSPEEALSSRESEVLALVLAHKKRKEIAEELHLSENTIKTYTRTLYGKVCVSSREELYTLLIK
jgi:DNA-binding NarL/FixJ family response regulator